MNGSQDPRSIVQETWPSKELAATGARGSFPPLAKTCRKASGVSLGERGVPQRLKPVKSLGL